MCMCVYVYYTHSKNHYSALYNTKKQAEGEFRVELSKRVRPPVKVHGAVKVHESI